MNCKTTVAVGQSPAMTVTADDRQRVKLPDARPGELFDYSRDAEGRIILRRMTPVSETKTSRKRLVRRKDGTTYFVGGVAPTTALVKKLLEDFP